MNDLAQAVDRFLNGDGPRNNGFFMFLFPAGQKRANYIGNCKREDMIEMMLEFLERNDDIVQKVKAKNGKAN